MKKYPRTFHCSFSEEVHSDDKQIDILLEDEIILNSYITISVKMDGGNCCIKPNEGVFARSHSSPANHETFDYIKNKHYYSKIGLLNPNYHYFGENMFGIHSIEYTELTDYFYCFNILDTKTNEWLSVEEVKQEAKRCGFEIVPIIFSGKWNKNKKEFIKFIKENMKKTFFGVNPEGFVIRKSNRFHKELFSNNVCKFVRKGHVQTDEHWLKNWRKADIL